VCETCDEGENPSGVCSEPKAFVWYNWRPSHFAHKYTKTKLMKRIEVVKVPTYKWVVEDVCCECAAGCECSEVIAMDAPMPKPTGKP
jgi:hypothetical protein